MHLEPIRNFFVQATCTPSDEIAGVSQLKFGLAQVFPHIPSHKHFCPPTHWLSLLHSSLQVRPNDNFDNLLFLFGHRRAVGVEIAAMTTAGVVLMVVVTRVVGFSVVVVQGLFQQRRSIDFIS